MVIFLKSVVDCVTNLHVLCVPLHDVIALADLGELYLMIRGIWLDICMHLLVALRTLVEKSVHAKYLTQFIVHQHVHNGHVI